MTQPEQKNDEIIETFPATIGDAVKEQLEDQESILPEFVQDPNFIDDILEVKVGSFIDIEVLSSNYKRKYFTEIDEKTGQPILVRKSCRVAGESRSDYHGLGLFIAPKGCPKQPFPLHINEYGITWVAFKQTNDEDDNRG